MDNICVLWNIHRCTLCSYRTRSSCNLKNHLKEHERKSKIHGFICHLHPPEKYQCEECQFQSHHKLILTNHFNKDHHKREETRPYLKPVIRYCENCTFQTYSLLVLFSHKCSDGNENGNFETSQTENYHHQLQKNQIQRNTKLKIKRFQCDHCLRRHTPEEEINLLKCDQCSYKAKKRADLNRHVLRKHVPPHEIKWFECDKCMYQSKEEEKLRRHVIFRHSQPAELEKLKRFRCDQCTFKTLLKSSLKRHVLRKHTPLEQIDWFRCEQCSYKGKDRYELRRHVLVWHTELWKH